MQRWSIGDQSIINANFDVGEDSTIRFGQRIMVTGRMMIVTHDGCAVSIGDDCLFSQEIALRAWDNHPIYDLRTRQRTNIARDITIESDVWVGNGVTMSGGAHVGHGSIIGTRSAVTASSAIGEHELAVGQPAKSVRKNSSPGQSKETHQRRKWLLGLIQVVWNDSKPPSINRVQICPVDSLNHLSPASA